MSLRPTPPSKRKGHPAPRHFPSPFWEEDSLKRAQLRTEFAPEEERGPRTPQRPFAVSPHPPWAHRALPSAISQPGQSCFASRGQAALRKPWGRPSPAHTAAPGASLPLCARRSGGAGSRSPRAPHGPAPAAPRPLSTLRPSRLRPSQSADRKGPSAANQQSAHWDVPAFTSAGRQPITGSLVGFRVARVARQPSSLILVIGLYKYY